MTYCQVLTSEQNHLRRNNEHLEPTHLLPLWEVCIKDNPRYFRPQLWNAVNECKMLISVPADMIVVIIYICFWPILSLLEE